MSTGLGMGGRGRAARHSAVGAGSETLGAPLLGNPAAGRSDRVGMGIAAPGGQERRGRHGELDRVGGSPIGSLRADRRPGRTIGTGGLDPARRTEPGPRQSRTLKRSASAMRGRWSGRGPGGRSPPVRSGSRMVHGPRVRLGSRALRIRRRRKIRLGRAGRLPRTKGRSWNGAGTAGSRSRRGRRIGQLCGGPQAGRTAGPGPRPRPEADSPRPPHRRGAPLPGRLHRRAPRVAKGTRGPRGRGPRGEAGRGGTRKGAKDAKGAKPNPPPMKNTNPMGPPPWIEL